MDNHILNDHNNPINWNGNNKECSECNELLNWQHDYEDICSECYNKEEEEEETKELPKIGVYKIK